MGDRLRSLNGVVQGTKVNQKSVYLEDTISEDNALYSTNPNSALTDLAEQMIIDAAYNLYRNNKITKNELDIFLHSHGLDDYFPKKTAKQIAVIINRRKDKIIPYRNYTLPETIRILRFRTAKKVRNEINKDDDC